MDGGGHRTVSRTHRAARATRALAAGGLLATSLLLGACGTCARGDGVPAQAPAPQVAPAPSATDPGSGLPVAPSGGPSTPAADEASPPEAPRPAPVATLTLTLSTGFMPDPEAVDGTVRATRPAAELSPQCAGFTTAEPAVVVVLGTALGAEARVGVRGKGRAEGAAAAGAPHPGPLGLAVVHPGGLVRCARASTADGLAIVAGPLDPGRYALYVLAPVAETPLRYALGLTEGGDEGLSEL
jgi:hypothetical protein